MPQHPTQLRRPRAPIVAVARYSFKSERLLHLTHTFKCSRCRSDQTTVAGHSKVVDLSLQVVSLGADTIPEGLSKFSNTRVLVRTPVTCQDYTHGCAAASCQYSPSRSTEVRDHDCMNSVSIRVPHAPRSVTWTALPRQCRDLRCRHPQVMLQLMPARCCGSRFTC